MNRFLKNFSLSLPILTFVFIFSALGFNLFCSQSASAYNVNKYYTLYEKSGTSKHLYYNGVTDTFTIINWSPRININKNPDGCGGYNGDTDIISRHNYTNCKGLTIQEVAGEPNNTWFEQAQYSFEIGDFDHSETMYVGGGYINNHGSSTDAPTPASNPGKYQNISAKSGANGCDVPNPNYSDDCSVLTLFRPTYANDFRITLDNAADSPTHEYWYEGPKHANYQTLTFDPTGGSVADNEVQSDGTIGDESTIWSHTLDNDVLREYVKGANANEYPKPTKLGYTFQGWYTDVNGGTRIYSRPMSNDETLYAHWGTVTHNSGLTPDITMTHSNYAEPGEDIPLQGSVTNYGDTSSSTDPSTTRWYISEKDGSGSYNQVPGDGSGAIPAGGSVSLAQSPQIPDMPVGTQICFKMSVEVTINTYVPKTDDAGNVVYKDGKIVYTTDINYGQPTTIDSTNQPCVTIDKKPKVQILGGDLVVGGAVTTSTSVKSNSTFGSWAEYGIIAGGIIKGTASGAAFAGTMGLRSANVSKYSTLSFTNLRNTKTSTGVMPACTSGAIGCYKSSISIPDVAASFPGSSNNISDGAEISADNLTNSGTYVANGSNLTLLASTLKVGKSIIIKATGTVTIIGDQTDANGPYTSISQIPQLVIIANKIVIYNSVSNVDAWLIANNSSGDGSIYTCETVGDTAGTCSNKLMINGPVMTDKLYLYRTAGSGTDSNSGDPAEVINLRADAYLWAYAQASATSRVQTIYTTELPPRL